MYDEEDTPLFVLHTRTIGQTLMVCVQRDCNGTNHYYRDCTPAQEAA